MATAYILDKKNSEITEKQSSNKHLEMLDILNEQLIRENEEPVA